MRGGNRLEFNISNDSALRFCDKLCVPKDSTIKREILEEAHHSHTVHPSSTKMHRDLREVFWWNNMKREIAHFVEQCLTCQQVKVEHQGPQGFCNHCLYLSGSGKISLWTLCVGYQELLRTMMLFGWWWIG